MRSKLITITGGSGYVGQLLRLGLAERGWQIRIFDRFRGPLANVLRRRYLGASRSTLIRSCAQRIRGVQKRLEPVLINAGVLRPSSDDILALRSQVAERLRGSYAVIHLAGIPHPEMPGATDADFQREEGSINVYEAAREAGVAKFLFASSGQIYVTLAGSRAAAGQPVIHLAGIPHPKCPGQPTQISSGSTRRGQSMSTRRPGRPVSQNFCLHHRGRFMLSTNRYESTSYRFWKQITAPPWMKDKTSTDG